MTGPLPKASVGAASRTGGSNFGGKALPRLPAAFSNALRHLGHALLDFAAWGAMALVIGLIGQVLR